MCAFYISCYTTLCAYICVCVCVLTRLSSDKKTAVISDCLPPSPSTHPQSSRFLFRLFDSSFVYVRICTWHIHEWGRNLLLSLHRSCVFPPKLNETRVSTLSYFSRRNITTKNILTLHLFFAKKIDKWTAKGREEFPKSRDILKIKLQKIRNGKNCNNHSPHTYLFVLLIVN